MTKKHINKFYILMALITLHVTGVKAQNFVINGIVSNAENNKPVEFANIGVENSYIGTASDLEGKFQMQLSHSIKDRIVRISAVGFRTKSIVVKKWIDLDTVKIHLAPVKYGISEVNVKAKSKVGYGILKTATNLIVDNYITSPYTYKCYIKTAKTASDSQINQSELLFLMADKNAYQNRSYTDAYKSRNYTITESLVDHELSSLKSGMTVIDQLINADIVRCPGNILSAESVNDFNVVVLGTDVIKGDSVWVINYTCNKPTMQNCGDPEAQSYAGKIWIAFNNNAVLKNWCEVSRNKAFIHGNTFRNSNKTKGDLFNYQVETNYKIVNGKYILDTIDYMTISNVETSKIYLSVIEVLPFDGTIQSRQYYNNTKNNTDFWDNLKRP